MKSTICFMAALVALSTSGSLAAAGAEPILNDPKFSLTAGAAFLRLNTSANFVDKDSGISIPFDAEGALGLPDHDTTLFVYGRYRFNDKHAISFGGLGIRRDSSASGSIDFGRLEISGEARLKDSTDFYHLNYTYTFREDSRSRVFGSLGLYGVDIEYSLDAVGQVTLAGLVLDEETFSRNASVFAPLPLIGLDAIFAISPRWSLGSKAAVIGGSVGDIKDALILDANIRAQYAFHKNWAGIIGLRYFNADFDVDKDDLRTEVNYSFDGLFIGLSLTL